MKKLTIITVTRNNVEVLKKCLESLDRTLDKSLYKLIVCDSGGTDKTDSWLLPWCKEKGIELRYIRSVDNIGWVELVNKAYNLSDTEFVLTTHDDIVYCKHWYTNMIRRFKQENVAAVGPVITYAMGPQAQAYAYHTFGIKVKYLLGLFFMCRKAVLDEVREEFNNNEFYLNPIYGLGDKEEVELSYLIRKLGYRLEIARDVLIEHTGEKTFIQELGSKQAFTEYQEQKLQILKDSIGENEVRDLYTLEYEKPVKIMFGIMTRTEYIHYRFVFSLLKIWGQTLVHKDLIHVARGHVAESRTEIVENFLKSDCTHLLFLDDDMVFEGDSLIKLLAHDVDIATYIAHQRGEPHAPCIFVVNPDTKCYYPMDVKNNGVVEIDAAGGYYLLIKREVLENMEAPYFIYGDKSLGYGGDKGIGEDLYFTTKAKLSGAEIYVDTACTIGHLGQETVIDDAYFKQLRDSGKLDLLMEKYNNNKK